MEILRSSGSLAMCIHSEKCWRGLPEVFNPKARPWINAEGADIDVIKAQVEKCPSGALSYRMGSGAEEESVNMETVVEQIPNGPLLVYGRLMLKNEKGEQVLENRTTAFCRCGQSSNKPFCDGAHVKAGFKG